jgi:hypothetical protein
MECASGCPGSLDFDACELDHLAPLLGFIRDEPKSEGDSGSTDPPRSANRALLGVGKLISSGDDQYSELA